MDFILFNTFVVSAILIVGFLIYGFVRKGRGEVVDKFSRNSDSAHLFAPLLAVLRGNKLPYGVKRTYVFSLYMIRKTWREFFHHGLDRAKKHIHSVKRSMDDRDPGMKNGGAASLYLKDIAEHKKKIVRENGYHD